MINVNLVLVMNIEMLEHFFQIEVLVNAIVIDVKVELRDPIIDMVFSISVEVDVVELVIVDEELEVYFCH